MSQTVDLILLGIYTSVAIAIARVLVLDVAHVPIPPTKKVKTEEKGEIHREFAEAGVA